jgi:hypothetical protein
LIEKPTPQVAFVAAVVVGVVLTPSETLLVVFWTISRALSLVERLLFPWFLVFNFVAVYVRFFSWFRGRVLSWRFSTCHLIRNLKQKQRRSAKVKTNSPQTNKTTGTAI